MKIIQTSIIVAFVTFAVLCHAIQMTKEGARSFAHYVFAGRITAIAEERPASQATAYFRATMSVERQIKGLPIGTNVVSLIYESPNSDPPQTFRCPPYVRLAVGQHVIVAASTNWIEDLKGAYYVGGADDVEDIGGARTNANHTSEGIRRPADGSPKPSR